MAKSSGKTPKKTGRRSKYHTHVEPRFAEITDWYQNQGATDKSVAKSLGIGEKTLHTYKLQFPQFLQLLKEAKTRLKRYRLATFNGSTRGTVATLTSSVIYEVNLEKDGGSCDGQTTNKRRTSDEPATTKKNERSVRKTRMQPPSGGIHNEREDKGRSAEGSLAPRIL